MEKITSDMSMVPTTIDDPMIVHNSENPGTHLVSTLLIGSANYLPWKESMLMALSAKNKLGFVDGSIKNPGSESPMFGQWRRCNDLVRSWITQSLSPELSKSVMYSKTAEKMWSDLEARFGRSNEPRIFELEAEIYSTRQSTMSIASYYTQLKALWDEQDLAEMEDDCCCLVGVKKHEKRRLR